MTASRSLRLKASVSWSSRVETAVGTVSWVILPRSLGKRVTEPSFAIASTLPCVLVVADPERIAELVSALSEPLLTDVAGGHIDLMVSSGGDDTIELVEVRKPHVIVVTATLTAGDATSLVDTIRQMLPRNEVAVVVIGDDEGGPVRNALDALELAPDRFVTRPVSPKALRFAVASGIEAVTLVRSPTQSRPGTTAPGVAVEARKPAATPDDA